MSPLSSWALPSPALGPAPLPSWSKWVSAPPGPGTEQTSLALRKVLHLFTSTRWPPASFCEVGARVGLRPPGRALPLLLHPPFVGERHAREPHTLTSVSLLLRVGTGWGKGGAARTCTSPPLHSSHHTDTAHTADGDMAWATVG